MRHLDKMRVASSRFQRNRLVPTATIPPNGFSFDRAGACIILRFVTRSLADLAPPLEEGLFPPKLIVFILDLRCAAIRVRRMRTAQRSALSTITVG